MKKGEKRMEKQQLSEALAGHSPHSENALFEGGFMESEIIEKWSLSNVQCSQSSITASTIYLADFDNTVFKNCDFSNTKFERASLYNTTFSNCKLVGADFTDGFFKDVRFDNCLLDFASFADCVFKKGEIAESLLRNARFFNCRFEKLALSGCNIEQAEFIDTKLAGIDLSSCSFQQLLTDGLDALKDCTVSAQQAVVIAEMIGVRLKGQD